MDGRILEGIKLTSPLAPKAKAEERGNLIPTNQELIQTVGILTHLPDRVNACLKIYGRTDNPKFLDLAVETANQANAQFEEYPKDNILRWLEIATTATGQETIREEALKQANHFAERMSQDTEISSTDIAETYLEIAKAGDPKALGQASATAKEIKDADGLFPIALELSQTDEPNRIKWLESAREIAKQTKPTAQSLFGGIGRWLAIYQLTSENADFEGAYQAAQAVSNDEGERVNAFLKIYRLTGRTEALDRARSAAAAKDLIFSYSRAESWVKIVSTAKKEHRLETDIETAREQVSEVDSPSLKTIYSTNLYEATHEPQDGIKALEALQEEKAESEEEHLDPDRLFLYATHLYRIQSELKGPNDQIAQEALKIAEEAVSFFRKDDYRFPQNQIHNLIQLAATSGLPIHRQHALSEIRQLEDPIGSTHHLFSLALLTKNEELLNAARLAIINLPEPEEGANQLLRLFHKMGDESDLNYAWQYLREAGFGEDTSLIRSEILRSAIDKGNIEAARRFMNEFARKNPQEATAINQFLVSQAIQKGDLAAAVTLSKVISGKTQG